MEQDVINVVFGLFIVGLCFRTLQLTLRIEHIERRTGLRRGPVWAPDDVREEGREDAHVIEQNSDGSSTFHALRPKA
jgi:hypothetical protein